MYNNGIIRLFIHHAHDVVIMKMTSNDCPSQVCQCFVFCALLEFALVNYASRSDMQRDRARERMERARRQWELEQADRAEGAQGQQGGGPGVGGKTPQQSGPNGLNHIGTTAGGAATTEMDGGIPGFALVS